MVPGGDRDIRELFCRGAELVHMPLRDHRVGRYERHAVGRAEGRSGIPAARIAGSYRHGIRGGCASVQDQRDFAEARMNRRRGVRHVGDKG